ncbi:MAG: serine/threonine protein kinase [Planctomycetaceae bacterium]|nr:serine/threonine protein kinase [Planctomycetaceae bacterium]
MSSSASPDIRSDRNVGRRKKGDVVWPFRILSVLGEGAMGDVYLAEHITQGFRVALKFMPEQLSRNKVLLARFRREMKVLQQLRHPNIVRCLSNLSNDKAKQEAPYYAMEYVNGGTFSDLLRVRVRLSAGETLHFALQILGALSAAHRQGVIHRDVKPSNLLISRNRKVMKLCDFGLVMVLGGTQLTEPGQTIGTPWYMSPEQIRGESQLTTASDLYSVGCILMEALTGKPPFVGDTHFVILNRHLSDEPDLVSSRVPDIEHANFLDRLISRLLEKDPSRRPRDAGALIGEIGALLNGSDSGAAGSPARSLRTSLAQKLKRPDSDPQISGKPSGRVMWARFAHVWQRVRQQKVRLLTAGLLLSVTCNLLLWLSMEKRLPLAAKDRAWLVGITTEPLETRIRAIPLIATQARTSPAALRSLGELLKAAETPARVLALRALSYVGPAASSLLDEVRPLQSDPEPDVRFAATEAVRCIRGEIPPLPYSSLLTH